MGEALSAPSAECGAGAAVLPLGQAPLRAAGLQHEANEGEHAAAMVRNDLDPGPRLVAARAPAAFHQVLRVGGLASGVCEFGRCLTGGGRGARPVDGPTGEGGHREVVDLGIGHLSNVTGVAFTAPPRAIGTYRRASRR